MISRHFHSTRSWIAQVHFQRQHQSSNEALAYRPAKEEWECGAAINFASPVCIDKFINHRRSDEYAGKGYEQSVSQFLACRKVGKANARGKAVRSLLRVTSSKSETWASIF